ncbi:MAG: hypothetical protein EOO03_07320 [Chitinophagaceae bacterium]|nr:MAG: hypothetical protein EOO03_07320 [Chitinophagaceae bacterium]
MNFKLFILAAAAVSFASCSTAYKSGQTPDDVYFSPVRVVDERESREDDRTDYRSDSYEEREIRMATRDRRWRDINDEYDYNYRYDPYRYGYNYGYYYNPYYYHQPIFLPGYTIVNPKNTAPRSTNLGSYKTPTVVVGNPKTGEGTRWVPANRSYNNSNSNPGSFNRRIITPSSTQSSRERTYERSNNVDYNNNNNRTYTPSSNSNSSSNSSSGSSGAPVSRPTRNN